jgi:hypothetical protein
MALPLNVFKTITKIVTTSPVGIYTAPVGYTGVILLAQCANIDSNTHTISFSHRRTTTGIAVTTEILKDFPIQGNDSVSLVQGKLTLESGDALVLSSSNSSNIKFIGSVLETLN